MTNNLDLSEDDVALICQALDSFVHVHLGQAPIVFDLVAYRGLLDKPFSVEQTLSARTLLEDAQEALTGRRHGHPGLGSPLVSKTARDAYHLKGRLEGDQMRATLFEEVDR